MVLQLFTGMTTATETRPDIAISSRITDFNVQISAVNIHSHCTHIFAQNCKFNLSLCYFSCLLFLKTTYGHSNVCIFCDQTHGRTNQLPIKIIIFFL